MSNLPERLEQSRAIWQQAISQYPNPYAVVMMISGGTDSITAEAVARYLHIPVTHIMHGITRTGIPETTRFVRDLAATREPRYIEADAGDAYERYVLRKGFYGRGDKAHEFAYHTLKHQHFASALSQNIRQGKRGRTILLLNGARKQESAARGRKIPDAIRKEPKSNNVWVSIIHDWTADDRLDLLDLMGVERNPVTVKLCRSGECMCGTTQNQQSREEAAYWYPDWGRWLDDLERRVMCQFPWKWGDDIPRWFSQTQAGQMALPGDDWLPMCHSCVNAMGDGLRAA